MFGSSLGPSQSPGQRLQPKPMVGASHKRRAVRRGTPSLFLTMSFWFLLELLGPQRTAVPGRGARQTGVSKPAVPLALPGRVVMSAPGQDSVLHGAVASAPDAVRDRVFSRPEQHEVPEPSGHCP